MMYEGKYEYIQQDDEIIITKYIGTDDKELTIPSTINGVDVVDIRTHAFEKTGTNLEKIILPSALLYINEETFKGCDNISYIVIPNSVITVFDDAFSGCRSLKTIEFMYAPRIHFFPNFLGDSFSSINKIVINGRCPIILMKYILNYAINYNIESLVKDEYLERIGQKSLEKYIEIAKEKGYVSLMQKFIDAYNKRFGKYDV